MRVMVKDTTKLKVVEHIILKNFWEYYVLDSEEGDASDLDPETKCCLVMGFEQEIGYVHMPEIQPYIAARTKKLGDVMPASGWKWV